MPGPLRRPVALVVAVAAAVFAVLAVRYAGTSAAGAGRRRGSTPWSIRSASHTVGWSGTPWRSARRRRWSRSRSLLAAICLLLGRRRLAVLAVVGPGLTGVCTTLLKPALGRTIDGGFAFPSGHTGGATSLGLVAALLVISLLRPGRSGALAILAAGALVVGGGVGAAMVASNAHYPTDTIGRLLHRRGGGLRRGAGAGPDDGARAASSAYEIDAEPPQSAADGTARAAVRGAVVAPRMRRSRGRGGSARGPRGRGRRRRDRRRPQAGWRARPAGWPAPPGLTLRGDRRDADRWRENGRACFALPSAPGRSAGGTPHVGPHPLRRRWPLGATSAQYAT